MTLRPSQGYIQNKLKLTQHFKKSIITICNSAFLFSQICLRKYLILPQLVPCSYQYIDYFTQIKDRSKVFIPVESIYSYEVNHSETLSSATPPLTPMRLVLTQESPAAPADCHVANNGAQSQGCIEAAKLPNLTPAAVNPHPTIAALAHTTVIRIAFQDIFSFWPLLHTSLGT